MSRKGKPPPVLSNGMSKLQSKMRTGNVLFEVLEVFSSTIGCGAMQPHHRCIVDRAEGYNYVSAECPKFSSEICPK